MTHNIPTRCATSQLAVLGCGSSKEIIVDSERCYAQTEFVFRPAPRPLALVRHRGHYLIASTNALLTRVPSQATHLNGPPVYPWAERGPQSTLLLDESFHAELKFWSGYRVVFNDRIWDFSPYAARGPDAPPPPKSPVTWKCSHRGYKRRCPYSPSRGGHLPFRVILWKYPKVYEWRPMDTILFETVNGSQVLSFLSFFGEPAMYNAMFQYSC